MTDKSLNKLPSVKLHGTCYTPHFVETLPVPIICVHGFGGTSTSFNTVKPRLGQLTKRKVYTIDMRNHGRSEWCSSNSVQLYAADLYQFMKESEITRAVLIGHSMGGRVVMQLALRHPEMVEKLIVEDTTPLYSVAVKDCTEKFLSIRTDLCTILEKLPASLSEVEARKKVTEYITHAFPEAPPNIVFPFHKEASGAFKSDINIESLYNIADDMSRIEMSIDEDDQYKGPVLFLNSVNSIIDMEEEKEKVVKIFPKAEFFKFQSGYHIFHKEIPDQYVGIVSSFICK